MKEFFLRSVVVHCVIIMSMLKSSEVFSMRFISLNDIFIKVVKIIPPLTEKLYKGEMGRIGIIGGSSDYTGAPYYAGLASLKFGADLAFVFSSKSATIPIKSYSPELIVTSFYDEDDDDLMTPLAMAQMIIDYFPRLHSLVIGPGLGRFPKAFHSIAHVLAKAKEDSYPTVIDADGLFFVTNHLEYVYNFHSCVLTPNKVEFNRLVDSAIQSLVSNTSNNDECSSSSDSSSKMPALQSEEKEVLLDALRSPEDATRLQALSQYLGGVLILLKGRYDMITVGKVVYLVQEEGSPRRCGGQGDILAGCLGVVSHWVNRLKKITVDVPLILLPFDQSKSSVEEDASDRESRTVTDTDSDADADTASSDIEEGEVEGIPPATAQQEQQQQQPRIVTITTFLLTSEQLRDEEEIEDRIIGAVIASIVTKRASSIAFSKKKRAMTSPDVLEALGEAFESLLED